MEREEETFCLCSVRSEAEVFVWYPQDTVVLRLALIRTFGGSGLEKYYKVLDLLGLGGSFPFILFRKPTPAHSSLI